MRRGKRWGTWLVAGLLAPLALAWPTSAMAHSGTSGSGGGVEQGIEQWPIWMAQAAFALAWLTYLAGARRQRPQFAPCLAFQTAMLVAGLALFGPLDAWAERSAAWHMVQHMLLIVVVAPLAVLTRPLAQWRAALGPAADAWWAGVHHLSRRPMACALLHAAALWFWHAPVPYIAALQSPAWHVLEHACFLFSGWLFWWAVLRPGRAGVLAAAAALLFTTLHTGMLGALLTFASVPLYASGPAALADQQLAGLVMWVPGGLIYLLAAVWAAWRWLENADAAPAARPLAAGSTQAGSWLSPSEPAPTASAGWRRRTGPASAGGVPLTGPPAAQAKK